MNERIKDLKEQALIWAIETLDPDALNDNEWAVAIDEKFAELIVRECAGICHKMAEDSDSYVVHDGDTCAEQIKKHFGVEE
jgi:hypothetical protein